MQKNSKWVFFLALAAMMSGLIVLSFQMMRPDARPAAVNTIAFEDYTGSHKRQGTDIIAENNRRAEEDLQRIRDSVGEGDIFTDHQNGHYSVTRKDGSTEEYEQVSGFAGFSTIHVKSTTPHNAFGV